MVLLALHGVLSKCPLSEVSLCHCNIIIIASYYGNKSHSNLFYFTIACIIIPDCGYICCYCLLIDAWALLDYAHVIFFLIGMHLNNVAF